MYPKLMVAVVILSLFSRKSWSSSSKEDMLDHITDADRPTIDWFSSRNVETSASHWPMADLKLVINTKNTSSTATSTSQTSAKSASSTGGSITTSAISDSSRIFLSSSFSTTIFSNSSTSIIYNTSTTTRNATATVSTTATTSNNGTTPLAPKARNCVPLVAVCLPVVGIFLGIALAVIGRRYRKFLGQSQQEHRRNFSKKNALEEVPNFDNNSGAEMEQKGHDELFLPDGTHVQRGTGIPMSSVNRYGTIVRKPLAGCC